MKAGRLKYDFAYGCFLFCGMTALLVTLMGKAAKDDNTSALLGFFLLDRFHQDAVAERFNV